MVDLLTDLEGIKGFFEGLDFSNITVGGMALADILGPVGSVCGYLGGFWVVGNLIYGIIRNDGLRCLIYGAASAVALVIALNMGGILNELVWAGYGSVIFGLHFIIMWHKHKKLVAVMYGIPGIISVLSFVGLL